MILCFKKITTFYFGCICLFYCSVSTAQTHPPVYREVIIQLPHLSADKNLDQAVVSLLSLGGIKYEGFCSQLKCLLLNADENIHPDNTAIMNLLKAMNADFVIKPTGKIHQVQESCKDPLQPGAGSVQYEPEK